MATWTCPQWAAYIGLAEAAVDIVILVSSVGIAYIGLASDDPSAADVFNSESVAKLVFAAALALVGYLGAVARLTPRRGRL